MKWTETFMEGIEEHCSFCLESVREKGTPCEACRDDGDHTFPRVVKSDERGSVIYNDGSEDHCGCCHEHFLPSKEEVAQALASIRDAITRNESSRSVDSVTGRGE